MSRTRYNNRELLRTVQRERPTLAVVFSLQLYLGVVVSAQVCTPHCLRVCCSVMCTSTRTSPTTAGEIPQEIGERRRLSSLLDERSRSESASQERERVGATAAEGDLKARLKSARSELEAVSQERDALVSPKLPPGRAGGLDGRLW